MSAAVFGTAEDCELGEVYEGSISYSERVRSFRFILSENSRITLNLKCNRGRCSGAIYHASGKEVLKREDLEFETNFFTGQSVAQLSRILPAGAYYMEIQNEGKWKWQTCRFSFWIQAQKRLQMAKGMIDSLKSTVAGQFTITCRAVENAIGYRIQYSMDECLKKDVKTVYSPVAVNIIKNLKKGERYYVRVCPYTVYDDGSYVFGENSYVKAIVTKK